MPTTLTEIESFLYESEIRYTKHENGNTLILGVTTKNYVNPSGTNSIMLVVELDEDGRYFSIFAPKAFDVEEAHRGAFMQTCGFVMYMTKLIQFEFDRRDGEVRPKIEFPLEDATLTKAQFMRCLTGIHGLLEEYYGVLQHVATTGEIPSEIGPLAHLQSHLLGMLEQLPESMRRDLIERLQRLGDQGQAAADN